MIYRAQHRMKGGRYPTEYRKQRRALTVGEKVVLVVLGLVIEFVVIYHLMLVAQHALRRYELPPTLPPRTLEPHHPHSTGVVHTTGG